MDHDTRIDGAEPSAVRLHLHRGIGWGIYGTATVFVLVLVVIGATSYLLSGRFVMAAVTAVVGLGLAGFLAVVTHAMVVPALNVGATGISGRMPRGNAVDVGWDKVSIDIDEENPDVIRLDVAGESVAITARSWAGVRDFVILVAGTPQAAERLTPAALQHWLRLLGVTDVEPADE